MSKEKIIETYIQATIKHGEATEKGNSKVANNQYKKIEKSYKQLKELGEDGIKELIKLLNRDEDYVKLWVASHVLSIEEHRAKETLKKLSSKPGFLGFTAKMTLEEWEKGKLQF